MSSKEYFETVAGEWDAIRQRLFPDSLRERAYGVAGIEPGRRAVDVGAGSGFLTEGLLAQGVSVVAVDEAEAMLATLGGKLGDRPGLELRAGGAERLPLTDGEVDYAFANMVLHHVEEPAAAVREMARVVRPGGRVVITDLDEHDFELLRREQHDRWLGFRRDDVQAWLEAAGLGGVRVECADATCCATADCGSCDAAISVFVAYGEKPASPQASPSTHRKEEARP